MIKKSLIHGSQGERWAKFFGGHKRSYDGQWPLSGRYFNQLNGNANGTD